MRTREARRDEGEVITREARRGKVRRVEDNRGEARQGEVRTKEAR